MSNTTTPKSNVVGVISLVVERIDGQMVVTTHASSESNLQLTSLFSAPTLKPATVEKPTLPAPAPVAPPAAVESKPATEESFESLLAKAKEMKCKVQLFKKDTPENRAKIKAMMEKKASGTPSTTTVTEKGETEDKGSGQKGGGFKKKPMTKERHKIKTSNKALIWNKARDKQLQVWIVEEIKTARFTGWKVCKPDEDGVDNVWIYGAVWAIPTDAVIEWLS
jgi:hypothetical protein